MGKLPHESEPLESMRQRFGAAVQKLVDVESVMLGTVLRPGEKREHVFDFDDGLRMIVSREVEEPHGVGVHFSASITEGFSLWARMAAACRHCHDGGRAAKAEFCATAMGRFADLSGHRGAVMFLGFSEAKGVPHFFVTQTAWDKSHAA